MDKVKLLAAIQAQAPSLSAVIEMVTCAISSTVRDFYRWSEHLQVALRRALDREYDPPLCSITRFTTRYVIRKAVTLSSFYEKFRRVV